MASLKDLCLSSIVNSIENGHFPPVHFLPPILRQFILDTVLISGTIDNPNCLETLSSPDFLRGMACLSTERGCTVDTGYLGRVSDSLTMHNIGYSISKLYLNLYWSHVRSISTIFRLIQSCDRLDGLNLRVLNKTLHGRDNWEQDKICGLFNKTKILSPALGVIENLTSLVVGGEQEGSPLFLSDHCPVVQFRNLKSLRLINTTVDAAWCQFLNYVRDTLEQLHLEDVNFKYRADQDCSVLPFPLPMLKQATFDCTCSSKTWFHRSHAPCSISPPSTEVFLKNLVQCDRLEGVLVAVDEQTEGEDWLGLLAGIRARLDVRVTISTGGNGGIVLTPDASAFTLVHLFEKKVKAFSLVCGDRWIPAYSRALKGVVDICTDLTTFRFSFRPAEIRMDEEDGRELVYAKSVLDPLFRNESRAMKLRQLRLQGEYDFDLLTGLFQNCLSLESLEFSRCPQLTDFHLIQWATRGARPIKISIHSCENITDEGLMPIVINSKGKLKKLEIKWCPKVTADVHALLNL